MLLWEVVLAHHGQSGRETEKDGSQTEERASCGGGKCQCEPQGMDSCRQDDDDVRMVKAEEERVTQKMQRQLEQGHQQWQLKQQQHQVHHLHAQFA